MNNYKRRYYEAYPEEDPRLTKPALQDEEKKVPETKTGVVIISDFFNRLNVRSSPEKVTSNVITTIEKGTKVIILESLLDWYKVEIPSGEIGYVDSRYIEV